MLKLSEADILDAINNFNLEGRYVEYYRYGNGHINDSFCVVCKNENNEKIKYILQRINIYVFHKPVEVMENMAGVTDHIRKKIIAEGGDYNRETLTFIRTKDGKPYYWTSTDNFFRMSRFIEGTTCYDLPESPNDFYEAGVSFGRFQHQLCDYPIDTLYETIVDFHNTLKRFNRFKEVVKEDKYDRCKDCKKEIDFYLQHEALAHIFNDLVENKMVPIRVTHNDTKLNNILMDNKTRKGLCVIDLDTVMPGLAMNDFGDAIRVGASTGLEDERDLSKVNFDIELYEAFSHGFIEGSRGSLTKMEIEMLPMGALVMTYECGMRFLTDYLENDVYFQTSRYQHNLDRCRTQIKLVSDMEASLDKMNNIILKYV